MKILSNLYKTLKRTKLKVFTFFFSILAITGSTQYCGGGGGGIDWTYWGIAYCTFIDSNAWFCGHAANASNQVRCFNGCKEGVCTFDPANQKWYVEPSKSGHCYKPSLTNDSCNSCGPVAVTSNALQIGYLATPADTTNPHATAIIPGNGTDIIQQMPIQVQFDRSIDSTSITFSGTISAEADTEVELKRTTYYNDTIVIKPKNTWGLGNGRSLNIAVKDFDESDGSVNLSFNIVDPNANNNGPDLTWLLICLYTNKCW